MADFQIGTTYWPRRKGALLWAEWDRGEVREELQQIAAAGIDTLRLPLHWEDFQPRPERVDTRALRLLEQALALAEDTRLRVVPGLFPLAIAGAIHIPAWTTAASFAADMMLSTKFGPLLIIRNESPPPLVWERTKHNTEVRDLWTNPAMREAQRKLIEEVVGNFGDHPIVSGWELGNGIELARVPSSPDAAAEWLGETADVARQYGARGTLYYGATLRSLVRRDGLRPDAIVAAHCTPVINLAAPEPALTRRIPTPELHRFIATLVRSLCGVAPVLQIGAPAIARSEGQTFADNAYGHAVEQPLLDHDGYARLVETSLPELRAMDVPAVWFSHAFCYAEPFAPPSAHSRREQMMGLFDTDGDELPVVRAVVQVAQQPKPETQADFKPLDVENYWNDPARHFQRLWEQWQSSEETP